MFEVKNHITEIIRSSNMVRFHLHESQEVSCDGFNYQYNENRYDIGEVSADGAVLMDVHPFGSNSESMLSFIPITERFTSIGGVTEHSLFITAITNKIVRTVSSWCDNTHNSSHYHLYEVVSYMIRDPHYVKQSLRWGVYNFKTDTYIQNVMNNESECPFNFRGINNQRQSKWRTN